jgi:DNA-directed RNA polymerase subunit K/omega
MEDQERVEVEPEGDDAPAAASAAADDELRSPANKYELVMVAAKEAERLNALYRNRHEKPPKKVTEMAIDRVLPGLTKFSIEEAEPEETGEQLPFFNPEL